MNSLSSFTAYASIPSQNSKIRFAKTAGQSLPQSPVPQDDYTAIEMVAPGTQVVHQARREEHTPHKPWYKQPSNIASMVSVGSGLGIAAYAAKTAASISRPLYIVGGALMIIGTAIQVLKRCCFGRPTPPPVIIPIAGGGADCGDVLAACGEGVVHCIGAALGGC